MNTIKKVLVGVAIALGLGVIANAASNPSPSPSSASIAPVIQATQSVVVAPTLTPTIKPATPSPTPYSTQSGLSNNNYYTNSSGNEVHSPAHSNTVPVGASAQCGDGTYSFSQHRSGTCSHHGGVSTWY